MATSTQPTVRDIRSMLDELFHLRMALATLSQDRDAAILRQLPSELQETVASIMQEFEDMQEHREQEEKLCAEQIRAAVRTLGMPVQGTYLQATYRPGNRSWDSDGLEYFAERERLPELLTYRHQGQPVVSILARTQRRRTTPMLYDTHSH
jgi:hypothetical protein